MEACKKSVARTFRKLVFAIRKGNQRDFKMPYHYEMFPLQVLSDFLGQN